MPLGNVSRRATLRTASPSFVGIDSASRMSAAGVRLADARGTVMSIPLRCRASGLPGTALSADAGQHQHVLVLAVAPDGLPLAALVLEPAAFVEADCPLVVGEDLQLDPGQ